MPGSFELFRRIEPARFNRACSWIGLAFLVLTISARMALDERHHVLNVQDFPQYYMAGLVARAGAWDALYPIPHEGSTINPGLGWNSELRPRTRELAEAHGVPLLATRYLQPPPLAVLFVPLALLSFKTAWYVWEALLILAAWGVARQAARIFEICVHRASHISGFLILLICLSPQAHRWVRVGNMSVIVAWLVGIALIDLVSRDGIRGGAALMLGTLSKYVLLVLTPLYLILNRWRTIAWAALLGALLIGGSMLLTGLVPYRTFAHDIAPTLGRTSTIRENQSLYPVLLRALHRDAPPLPRGLEISFQLIEVVSILGLLAIIFTRGREHWKRTQNVFAAALALLTWLLIFSPISWEHYHAFVAPLWGWIVFEGLRSKGKAVLAIASIALSWLPISLIVPSIDFSLFLALVCMFVMSLIAILEPQSRTPDDL